MTSTKFWFAELETDMLDHIKAQRLLWDPEHPLFRKTLAKSQCLKEISESLCKRWPQYAKDLNPDAIIKRYNNIKGYYRREVKKLKNFQGKKKPHVCTWGHFNRLSYLGEDCSTTVRNSPRKPNVSETEKGPTIISLSHNSDATPDLESDDECNDSVEYNPCLNMNKMMTAVKTASLPSLTPSAENIDDMFGHFVVSILKSIPESRKKDNLRMKIVQDLFHCKNS